MNKILMHALIASSAFLMTQCVNVSPLQVSGFRSLVVADGSCSSGAAAISSSTLDVARDTQIALGIGLTNTLASNRLDKAASDPGRANTHDIFITEVDVAFTGGPAADEKHVTNIRVNAGQTTDVFIPVLSRLSGQGLVNFQGTLIANITLKGTLLDGSTVETDPQAFPIEICKNCLPKPACTVDELIGCTKGMPFGSECPGTTP